MHIVHLVDDEFAPAIDSVEDIVPLVSFIALECCCSTDFSAAFGFSFR